jgi:hypothetical protein
MRRAVRGRDNRPARSMPASGYPSLRSATTKSHRRSLTTVSEPQRARAAPGPGPFPCEERARSQRSSYAELVSAGD